jgi:hypothetical protein
MMEKTHEKECMSVYQSTHMRDHMDLGLPGDLEFCIYTTIHHTPWPFSTVGK